MLPKDSVQIYIIRGKVAFESNNSKQICIPNILFSDNIKRIILLLLKSVHCLESSESHVSHTVLSYLGIFWLWLQHIVHINKRFHTYWFLQNIEYFHSRAIF